MRVLLFLFIFISSYFYCGVDASKTEKPFLAVFSNPGTWCYWEKYHPNLYFTAKDFDDLPIFLDRVKNQIKPGQELILDIDCHGSEDGLLYIHYEAFNNEYLYSCTVGALLNKIKEAKLKPSKMYLEACYSQICMETSLSVPVSFSYSGNIYEPYKYKTINYPVYGVGTCPNISNLIYLQDKYGVKPYFTDLRLVVGQPRDTPDNSKGTIDSLKMIWTLLFTYGT